jgi:hypothetical protein
MSQTYKLLLQQNYQRDKILENVSNKRRLQNYKIENEIRGLTNDYLYNWEIDDYKNHINWLIRLEDDENISDEELSDEDGDIISDDD